VLSCIEVKSSFSRKNIKDAYEKFLHLENELTMTSGIHDDNNNPQPQIIVKPHYRLFIFESKAKKYSPELFLNIYKEMDPNWNSHPLIMHVCIAGKGAFCFTSQGWIHMEYDDKESIHEEVISFLGTVVQDLPLTELSRGIPKIGYYLTDTYKMDRLIEGKLHVRPWRPGKLVFKLTDLNKLSDLPITKL
jgi:hypothetical protein